MVFELYSIKDKLADEYGPIYQAKNLAIAERAFNSMVIEKGLNSEEYELTIVGYFENETGELMLDNE